ncbi:HD-GYP domain-containing protein [Bacillus infantis]|uniref:HD-GYP domain-containing protein n=1 Tax=Bacillus infantis TaxID=324767 RepID=UPI003CE8D81E
MGIINEDRFIETVHMKGLQISLLASGDGTEVIYHKLQPGTRWGIEPQDGWDALEFLQILSGGLKVLSHSHLKDLQAGDSFHECPIRDHYFFESIGETEFLFVTSQPVFHFYSKISNELKELAVSIEEKDGYTKDHCDRIKTMATLVGEKAGLSSKQLMRLNLASFLHDIGKVKIPISILQKPGKLTPEEWELMKLHTVFGKQILVETKLPSLIEASVIVEQHHERFDGLGYPYNLEGDQISTEASIISVVDAFDAMTTNRIYQSARTREEAFEEILRCRGTMYNPYIVDIFLSLKENI